MLANKPVRYIGTISYGMYLLHMLANNAARKIAPGLGAGPTFVVTLIVAIALASISYQFYERRFLKLKERFGGRVRPAQSLSAVIRPGHAAAS
jgi:peptidoglycan/LPS O-acetylase OafA/YrhL